MAEKIRLELPAGDRLDAAITTLSGWCTAKSRADTLSVRVNGQSLRHARVDRGDVRRVFPGVPSFGFSCELSPQHCLQSPGGQLAVELRLGATVLEKAFVYTPEARAAASAWERAKQEKRAWCLERLLCPLCRQARPVLDASGALVCPGCQARLEQQTAALNLLPAQLYGDCLLQATDLVSAHAHAPAVVELIAEVRRDGGRVLDCGAGYRDRQDPAVINLEIVDYPSTDVLAVGQALPFVDGAFDLVLSLAVLEHVDDPFACAAELVRVVRPGGKIFCVAPFLQPEHGYPNHFFNMSRQGLARLFAGRARLVQHEVPSYGAPIYTLCWFLHEYLAGLPPAARRALEGLSIKEVAELRKAEFGRQPYVKALSEEARWRLASVTAALLVRDE